MDGQLPQAAPAQWKGDLSVREQIQITHAQAYARTWSDAGIPGHNHIMLIARLAKKLDDMEYSARNPLTSVDTSLLTPADIKVPDATRPPDVSKKPQGFT